MSTPSAAYVARSCRSSVSSARLNLEVSPGHVMLETATLEEHMEDEADGHISFPTVADHDGALKSGMSEGAADTIDRFTKHC
jgi:hypothetical protein